MLQGGMDTGHFPPSSLDAAGIGPLWLRGRWTGDRMSARLPSGLRLSLARAGHAFILAWHGEDGATLTVRDGGGHALSTVPLAPDEQGVFLPAGSATLDASAPGRLGLYPRSKLGLKLHAVLNGRFPGLPALRRWREASAAARDLRATHAALLEHSDARRQERALAFRRYRARFVGDFDTVPPAGAAPRLCFLGPLGRDMEAAAARLAALAAQSDPNWRFIAFLPEEAPPALAAFAAAQAARDPRISVRDAQECPASAINMQVEGLEDGLVCLLPYEGLPTPDAVALLRDAFARHPDAVAAYTDEERTSPDGLPEAGLFKPAYNRHLLRATDYVGALLAVRTAAFRSAGGLHGGLGPVTLHEFHLRLLEPLAPGAILHIPRIAFSAPEPEPVDPRLTAEAVESVLGTSVDVLPGGGVRPHLTPPKERPLVSLIIPTRDRADLLGMALRSLIAMTAYRDFEIVIVDNASVMPETFALFEEIKAIWPATQVVRDDGAFNYPRICNAGVAAARGEVICLLNNDIEVVEAEWLDEMVALASTPRTGIVGAKLLFPDRTLQHAGVVVGLFRYAAHGFSHAAEDLPGPFGRLASRVNVSAVTGACLMISRACWDRIGPLDAERFAEDCNDIDLCLRARRAGYEVVWTPFACLIHHESASRGRRRTKAHRERLKAQRRRMEALWHTRTLVDPHYNPNLARSSLHAALAEAPEGPRDPRTDAI